ncbi:hypothetical protein [Petroclostridium sp. X23]|uniref:hypothetical protein n=1 Tax=Petroclostridium sp. X23 TaxID=3045146 RepID=UPI0024AE14EF|nr:hypothetical protein [Petroclostridium sp. X23]WHH58767.1 hypothetical protein QKW49_23740 [Petroclostridium sp. X23]
MKIKTRLIIIYAGLIILFISVQGIFIQSLYNKTADDVGQRAITISQVVARSIDLERYEEIVRTKDRNDHFYQMQDYFSKVQQETGVDCLYIKHKISESQIEYIYDSDKDSLGEPDDLFTPEAYTNGTSLHTGIKSYEKWGTFITGYSPLINKNGDIIGAVGTDIEVGDFYDVFFRRMRSTLIYTANVTLMISLLIFITMKRNILWKKNDEKD